MNKIPFERLTSVCVKYIEMNTVSFGITPLSYKQMSLQFHILSRRELQFVKYQQDNRFAFEDVLFSFEKYRGCMSAHV